MAPKPKTKEVDYEDQMIGPAYRAVFFERGADGNEQVCEGPDPLTREFIHERMDYYAKQMPYSLRKFIAVDTNSKPPRPIAYGLATDECDELIEELTAFEPIITSIFWEE